MTKAKTPAPTTDCGAPDEEQRARDKQYAHDYYVKNKEKRSEAHKRRWREDPDFRKRELARAKEERAAVRASKAQDKFAAMVAAKQEAEAKKKRKRPPRRPRMVSLTGRPADLQEVYTSGAFAHAIGREGETIRDWLNAGVLPGASAYFGEGIGRKAYFTDGYIKAVYRACERLYFMDGNGRLDILKTLVAEELASAGESYIPPGGTDADRVWPKKES